MVDEGCRPLCRGVPCVRMEEKPAGPCKKTLLPSLHSGGNKTKEWNESRPENDKNQEN